MIYFSKVTKFDHRSNYKSELSHHFALPNYLLKLLTMQIKLSQVQ